MSEKLRLALAGLATALLAIGTLFAVCHGQPRQGAASQAPSPASPGPAPSGGGKKAVVGIGRGTDHAAAVAQAIQNAGGLERVVKKGGAVIIKPNLSSSRGDIAYPGNTDYRVVAEVARQALALGAGRVIVAEGAGTGRPLSPPVIAAIRYDTIQGVEFLDLNEIPREECYYVSSSRKLTKDPIYMPKVYVDADAVISVPKLKTNYAVGPSLGLKNGFGAPPKPLVNDGTQWKWGLHNRGIENSIVEINLLRKPDFVVIDGIVAGEGSGPTNNDPVDARVVFAGDDVLAVDTVASYFMGFNPLAIPHLQLAAENGLGEYRLWNIQAVGADLDEIRMDFDSPFPKG
jgi:uncharacterized protein (DUF362 family)